MRLLGKGVNVRKVRKMDKKVFEEAREFIDENTDAKGILLIFTDEKGNIRVVTHGISPFERMGIGKYIQDMAYKSIITKPTETDTPKLLGAYVS